MSRKAGPFSSHGAAQRWIEEVLERQWSFIFAVTPRALARAADSTVIGVVGLNRWGTVFYMFRPDFSGRGYCTEALQAFLIALFERQKDRDTVEAAVFQHNNRSLRVLQKCGFAQILHDLHLPDLDKETKDKLKQALQDLDLPQAPSIRALDLNDETQLRKAVETLTESVEKTDRRMIHYRYSRPSQG